MDEAIGALTVILGGGMLWQFTSWLWSFNPRFVVLFVALALFVFATVSMVRDFKAKRRQQGRS